MPPPEYPPAPAEAPHAAGVPARAAEAPHEKNPPAPLKPPTPLPENPPAPPKFPMPPAPARQPPPEYPPAPPEYPMPPPENRPAPPTPAMPTPPENRHRRTLSARPPASRLRLAVPARPGRPSFRRGKGNRDSTRARPANFPRPAEISPSGSAAHRMKTRSRAPVRQRSPADSRDEGHRSGRRSRPPPGWPPSDRKPPAKTPANGRFCLQTLSTVTPKVCSTLNPPGSRAVTVTRVDVHRHRGEGHLAGRHVDPHRAAPIRCPRMVAQRVSVRVAEVVRQDSPSRSCPEVSI